MAALIARPCACSLPLRSGERTSVTPRWAKPDTMESVASSEQSEATRMLNVPPGYSRARVFSSLSAIRACSLRAATMTVTWGLEPVAQRRAAGASLDSLRCAPVAQPVRGEVMARCMNISTTG